MTALTVCRLGTFFGALVAIGSPQNAILLLCAHAQGVRAPLTIAPRPRLLCHDVTSLALAR